MSGLNHKINNSYESDPLSSNGVSKAKLKHSFFFLMFCFLQSSTDSTSLDKSIDCTSQTQLSKLLNRNLLENNEITANDQSPTTSYQCQIRPKIIKNLIEQNSQKNQSSAESSDFEGFSDGSTPKSHFQKSVKCASSNESDFEGFPPSEKNKLTQESITVSDSSKFDSEEISDQDVRFEKEIKTKNLDFLLNDHLQDITNFSVEPSSSNDEQPKKNTTIIMFHEENAVDNNISKDNTLEGHSIGDALSFDGKIQGISTKSADISHINLNMFDGDSSSRQINEQSPTLFDDTDDNDDNNDDESNDTNETDDTLTADMSKIEPEDNNNVLNKEKRLLRKIQTSLSGVLPPPSITLLQMDLTKMLAMYKNNINNQNNENPSEYASVPNDCLYRKSHSIDEIKQMEWPQAQQAYAHGIHYNRSLESEKIELLCMKYVERKIGAETSSSFTINTSPSSAKKRTIRTK